MNVAGKVEGNRQIFRVQTGHCCVQAVDIKGEIRHRIALWRDGIVALGQGKQLFDFFDAPGGIPDSNGQGFKLALDTTDKLFGELLIFYIRQTVPGRFDKPDFLTTAVQGLHNPPHHRVFLTNNVLEFTAVER